MLHARQWAPGTPASHSSSGSLGTASVPATEMASSHPPALRHQLGHVKLQSCVPSRTVGWRSETALNRLWPRRKCRTNPESGPGCEASPPTSLNPYRAFLAGPHVMEQNSPTMTASRSGSPHSCALHRQPRSNPTSTSHVPNPSMESTSTLASIGPAVGGDPSTLNCPLHLWETRCFFVQSFQIGQLFLAQLFQLLCFCDSCLGLLQSSGCTGDVLLALVETVTWVGRCCLGTSFLQRFLQCCGLHNIGIV